LIHLDRIAMADSYYQKNKKKILKRLKELYRTDKEFRDKVRKRYRERYQTDSDYKQKTLKNARSRYHTDSVYRQKTIERSRQRHKKLKGKKLKIENEK
jgi:hypothetical protein